MWTECNIGGGEEIEGYEDGGPPTLCQPASQQGDGIPMTSSTQEIDTRGFVEKQWSLMCSLEFL